MLYFGWSWLLLEPPLQLFVGQNYGAHLYDRIQKGARTALTIALTIAVSLSVILCFGGSYITKLFSSDPAIVNQCQSLILFLMPFYFSYCCVEIFFRDNERVWGIIKTNAFSLSWNLCFTCSLGYFHFTTLSNIKGSCYILSNYLVYDIILIYCLLQTI